MSKLLVNSGQLPRFRASVGCDKPKDAAQLPVMGNATKVAASGVQHSLGNEAIRGEAGSKCRPDFGGAAPHASNGSAVMAAPRCRPPPQRVLYAPNRGLKFCLRAGEEAQVIGELY